MEASSSAGRKLSVAIISRDADATLGAALESVRSVADEIVVIDTGSVDRTREIARRRASKLVDFAWTDDFSAARNFALQQISGDWVLWLDASEQLEAESGREIRRWLDGQPDAQGAYLLMVQMPPGDGQIDGEQVGRLRLWSTRAGLKYTGRVREQVTPDLASVGLTQQTNRWRIHRSPRDVAPQIKAAKARRDLRLAELEMHELGERSQLLLVQGEAWTALGEPLKGAGWFRQVVDSAPRGSTEQLEAFYGLLTTFDSRPQTADQQVATCIEALAVFPLDAQLLCAMGSYMQNQGRLDLACRCYGSAVEHGQVNLQTWHLANLVDIATVCHSLTLELLNQPEAARAALEQGLAARGSSERLRRQLIDLHIKHNRRQEALGEVQHLAAARGLTLEPLRNAIRGACLAATGQQWSPALILLRTAHEAGCRDLICLRWLASSLIATGEVSAATIILRQWQTLAPESPEPRSLLAAIESPEVNQAPPSPAAFPGALSGQWRADNLPAEAATPLVTPAPVSAPRFIDFSNGRPHDSAVS